MKTKKMQEIKHDYTARILKLQRFMKANGLDAFIVSTQDSIYYLSGASYMPVERPFFIIVREHVGFTQRKAGFDARRTSDAG